MSNLLISKMHVLETIDQVSLNTVDPMYKNYPAMKLGGTSQIYFFADLMYEKIINIISSENQLNTDRKWILSAPAYFELPAAANLMARYIYRRLCDDQIKIQIIEPRLNEKQIVVNTHEEFSSYHNCCNGSHEQRFTQRSRIFGLNDSGLPEDFNGASVVVINDIYVTGTQQQFILDEFKKSNVRDVHWVYIFKLSNLLAQSNPEFEHQLNDSYLNNENFIELLNDKNTEHTSRCISRLFYEDYSSFCSMVKQLNSRVKSLILSLCLIEQRYNHALFEDKMAFLESQQCVDVALQFYV